jgi:hypothetical protein
VIVVTSDESTTNIFVDPVATVNSAPEIVSVTEINGPVDPLIDNTVEPDLYMFTLPVAFNEPDMFTVWFSWLTYDAVDANDADTAFSTYDAVCAVTTYDAVAAWVAYDAVPFNTPLNEPLNEPVLLKNVSIRLTVAITDGIPGCTPVADSANSCTFVSADAHMI